MEAGGQGIADVQDPLGFINTVDPNVDQVLSTFVNPNSGSQYAIDGHLQSRRCGLPVQSQHGGKSPSRRWVGRGHR